MRDYFLRTERLGFGHWNDGDLALAWTLWGDSRVSALIGGPFGLEDVRARLGREIEMMAMQGVQYWPLFLLEDGGFVGCAGLRPHKDDERVFEFGVHLLPEYWGRGVALEAGRAVIGFAFGYLNVKGLFAGHHPENAASERLIKRLGFCFTHEEFYAPTSLKHPSYLLMKDDASACAREDD